MGINVLSLFDGMSCGRVALERAGIEVDNYYASEIDKHAIKVALDNYPDTIQLGDVTKWREWDLPKIDLVLAGSPCQGFSYAGNQLAFDDPRSKLFFQFVDIMNNVQPKHFLLENVVMKPEHLDVISNTLNEDGWIHHCGRVNSKLVSAQNRDRIYWSTLPMFTPADKGITLESILENCPDGIQGIETLARGWNKGGLRQANKMPCLTTSSWQHNHFVHQLCGTKRKFTVTECERSQTLPDGYTAAPGVSDTQRYKMLGNGWTVDVIAHILKGLKGKI